MEPALTTFAIASTVMFVHGILSVGFSASMPGPSFPNYDRAQFNSFLASPKRTVGGVKWNLDLNWRNPPTENQGQDLRGEDRFPWMDSESRRDQWALSDPDGGRDLEALAGVFDKDQEVGSQNDQDHDGSFIDDDGEDEEEEESSQLPNTGRHFTRMRQLEEGLKKISGYSQGQGQRKDQQIPSSFRDESSQETLPPGAVGKFGANAEFASSVHKIHYFPNITQRTASRDQAVDGRTGEKHLDKLFESDVKDIWTTMMWSHGCGSPVRRVVTLAEAEYVKRGYKYFPSFTLVYRCDHLTGCCSVEKQVCGPVRKETVWRTFRETNSETKERRLIQFDFENHLECGCRARDEVKAKSSADEMPRDQEAEDLSWKEWQEATNNVDPECECPHGFIAEQRVTGQDQVTCDCRCYHDNRLCTRRIKGLKQLPDLDHQCILDGECHPPTCSYGTYDKNRKKCPNRKEEEKRSVRSSKIR